MFAFKLPCFIIFAVLFSNVSKILSAPTTDTPPSGPTAAALTSEISSADNSTICGHTIGVPGSFFKRHFDASFLKKFFKHWNPFSSVDRVKMQFFLYKRDFPDCGREILSNNDQSLELSGFNADHPTRVIIHGWMSQSRGKLMRLVKNAYMSLVRPKFQNETSLISSSSARQLHHRDDDDDDDDGDDNKGNYKYNNEVPLADYDESSMTNTSEDFNVIVVDWSVISSNANYFSVVDLIEDLGFILADFLRFLHSKGNLYFGDLYLIGHSLGAQIAGIAGKHVKPFRINTIFALDPAGPKFRNLPDDKRIDPSDADYVESIQTSSSLGFEQPVGHATFYPNYGHDQKKCYIYGCSHSRSYNYFAESITSRVGFWGTLTERRSDSTWILSDTGVEFKMGGEPATPKRGTFYVKTNDRPPYAMGKIKLIPVPPKEDLSKENDVK